MALGSPSPVAWRKARRVLLAFAGLAVFLGVAIAVASALGTQRFRERYEAEKSDLLRRGRAAPARVVDPAAVAALPEPVKRYVEVTGVAGKAIPHVAVLKQRGALRTAADAAWMPFEAEQAYSMDPPGFVWLARARVAPAVHVMARDRFVGGEGNMLIRALGAVTIADGRGPQMDQGAGLRYWGEVIDFPELAVDPHLRWEPIDASHARLTIVQGSLDMRAVVDFDASGLPVAVHGQRYRDVGGKPVLTAWSGYERDWKVIDGRLFPSRWESVWHLAQGDLTAVTIEILHIEID